MCRPGCFHQLYWLNSALIGEADRCLNCTVTVCLPLNMLSQRDPRGLEHVSLSCRLPAHTRWGHRTLFLVTPRLYCCKVAGDDCSYEDFLVCELTLPDHMVVELIGTFAAILLL